MTDYKSLGKPKNGFRVAFSNKEGVYSRVASWLFSSLIVTDKSYLKREIPDYIIPTYGVARYVNPKSFKFILPFNEANKHGLAYFNEFFNLGHDLIVNGVKHVELIELNLEVSLSDLLDERVPCDKVEIFIDESVNQLRVNETFPYLKKRLKQPFSRSDR